MNQITTSSFKKPYFIDILGEEGLTARDISESLNVPIFHIHQRIKRSFLAQTKDIQDWRIITTVMTIDSGTYTERESETFILNIRSAKAFVATYDSKFGRSYLNFLFDCEKVATEITPKLIAEIQLLKEKLEATEQGAIKRDKKLLRAARKGTILAPVYRETLYGLERRWEMKNQDTLDQITRLKAQMEHSQVSMEGLMKKIRDLQKRIDGEDLDQKNKMLHLIKNESLI